MPCRSPSPDPGPAEMDLSHPPLLIEGRLLTTAAQVRPTSMLFLPLVGRRLRCLWLLSSFPRRSLSRRMASSPGGSSAPDLSCPPSLLPPGSASVAHPSHGVCWIWALCWHSHGPSVWTPPFALTDVSSSVASSPPLLQKAPGSSVVVSAPSQPGLHRPCAVHRAGTLCLCY
jgi:hypothetical protein